MYDTAQRILDAIDPERVVELEKGLVAIPSYTTQETPLATFIVDYLRSVGVEAELQEVPLGGGKISHNAIGRIRGVGGGKSLTLTGHMDHLPILGQAYDDLSHWQRKPFEPVVEGEWLYGKGCQDEKGGICASLIAAEALTKAGIPLRGDLLLVLVQGHKRLSSGTLHWLDHGQRTDYVINTENSGNMIIPSWVGRLEGRIHIRAPEMHFHYKEIYPKLKPLKTAFFYVAQLIQALGPEMQPPDAASWMSFTPEPSLPGYPQFRLEMIEFHRLDHLALSFQIRIVPDMTDDTVRADLIRLLDRLRSQDDGFTYELEIPRWPTRPGIVIPQDEAIVHSLARWHTLVWGEPAQIGPWGRLGAAADASHFVDRGITTVLYGPGGGMTDTEYGYQTHIGAIPEDERIRVSDIVNTARVLALTAWEICGT